ncbi:hypothetical protein [uncultured Rheinheimera sp.]|uniref:hypothetical protein n=1 Tax=uncultured Rheinheimera sp. TaxID=400532 RepID=UPI0025984251|nr:hypothetical protein [uncultured Rheinheimera sp.]
MKDLTLNQIEEVNGGLLPAIYGGLMAYNYAVAVYGGAQVAAFAGGAGLAIFTYLN